MNRSTVESLSYAVRGRFLLKYFGQICLVGAVLTSISLAVSLLSQEFHLGLRYGCILAILFILGRFLGSREAPGKIQKNEALVVISSIFLFMPLLFSYALMGSGLSFVDAFFEAVSGITTTGLSTLKTVEDKPVTFLFSRAWLQWSGGLGIVVFAVALLLGSGVTARRLADIEENDDIVGNTKLYARRIIAIYAALTLLGFIIILLAGVGPFPALVHSLASISTGGFSSYDRSLESIGLWWPRGAVIFVSVLGAMPLAIYYRCYHKGISLILGDDQIRVMLGLCVLSSLLLWAVMSGSLTEEANDVGHHAALMAFSAQTTSGFSSIPVSSLNPMSKIIMIFSMATGGAIGSTAGGIKVFRLIVLFRMISLLLVRFSLAPHAVLEPRVAGHRLGNEEIDRMLLYIIMFVVVILLSWLPFIALGYDPLDSLFEVVSATGTVGLSSGITSLYLPTFLKLVLCVDMLMGRLEIFALLLLFYPRTWVGRRNIS